MHRNPYIGERGAQDYASDQGNNRSKTIEEGVTHISMINTDSRICPHGLGFDFEEKRRKSLGLKLGIKCEKEMRIERWICPNVKNSCARVNIINNER